MHCNDWFISENVEQGADKDVGGGEDPEVLQKVPQKEISAEGVKKEGFHFDYCFATLTLMTMMLSIIRGRTRRSDGRSTSRERIMFHHLHQPLPTPDQVELHPKDFMKTRA